MLPDRINTKISVTPTCWFWSGRTANGYGVAYWNRKTVYVHRLIYETHRGRIPHGLVIDHLCRNTLCVNPEHLEVVTTGENVRRGLRGRLRTHCQQGHLFTRDTTVINNRGHRSCRICAYVSNKKAVRKYGSSVHGREVQAAYRRVYQHTDEYRKSHREYERMRRERLKREASN